MEWVEVVGACELVLDRSWWGFSVSLEDARAWLFGGASVEAGRCSWFG
jgi:hypothetical protein